MTLAALHVAIAVVIRHGPQEQSAVRLLNVETNLSFASCTCRSGVTRTACSAWQAAVATPGGGDSGVAGRQ